jgi:quinoprotein glucose dehydrogenase
LTEDITADPIGTRPTNFMVTPIMVADRLFYCTPYNRVCALDPPSGAEYWVFDPQVDISKEALSNCRAVSSWQDQNAGPGMCNHRIILVSLDARLIALDVNTGKRCNSFGGDGEVSLNKGRTEHRGSEYGITSAPAIIGDTAITGAFVQDSHPPDVPSGVVRAYNIRTGKFLWGWNPVHPDSPQVDDEGNFVACSTNVWSTISVDEELGLVIVPTGNSSPDYYGGGREAHLDYYSGSVVALNATECSVAWHYQTLHHD